jgi:hypothetical protein
MFFVMPQEAIARRHSLAERHTFPDAYIERATKSVNSDLSRAARHAAGRRR